jgi:hypothetical protein
MIAKKTSVKWELSFGERCGRGVESQTFDSKAAALETAKIFCGYLLEVFGSQSEYDAFVEKELSTKLDDDLEIPSYAAWRDEVWEILFDDMTIEEVTS